MPISDLRRRPASRRPRTAFVDEAAAMMVLVFRLKTEDGR